MRVRYVAAAMGMAIAIPFMAPVPAYADEPGTTVFSDNFATQNTSLWAWGAGASVSNGQLVLQTHNSYDGNIVSNATYNFTDCAFTAQPMQFPSPVGNGSNEGGLVINAPLTTLRSASTSAYSTNRPNTHSLPWDPTAAPSP